MKSDTKRIAATVALVGAGLGAAWYWLSRPTKIRPAMPQQARVLLVGDSLAIGLTHVLDGLARRDGTQFRALTKLGSRIASWSRSQELQQALTSFAPTTVLICLGTNDAALTSPTGEQGELEVLIRTASKSGSALVWIDPPEMPTLLNLKVVLKMLDSSAAAKEVGMIRYDSRQLDIPRQPDAIHPTGPGYAMWGSAIWAFLRGARV